MPSAEDNILPPAQSHRERKYTWSHLPPSHMLLNHADADVDRQPSTRVTLPDTSNCTSQHILNDSRDHAWRRACNFFPPFRGSFQVCSPPQKGPNTIPPPLPHAAAGAAPGYHDSQTFVKHVLSHRFPNQGRVNCVCVIFIASGFLSLVLLEAQLPLNPAASSQS